MGMTEGALVESGSVPGASTPGETDVLDTSAAGGLVVRGGTMRVLSYLCGVLVSAIGAALMLRYLGVRDFGRYATVLSFITIIGALSDLGLTAIGLRKAAVGDRAERDRVLRNVLGMRLATATAGIALACAFGIAVNYPPVIVEGIALAGVGLIALLVLDNYTMRLQLELRLTWTAALLLVVQAFQTSVVVILVLAAAPLLLFMGSQIPGTAVTAVIAGILVHRGARLLPSFDRSQWLDMARELLPYAAASAMGAVYFRVGIVVLSLISTGTQTGLFGAAFRITEIVVGIPWLVASSALPVIFRTAVHDRERFAYALRQLFDASLAAGVGIAIAIYLGAPFAIELVAGPHYGGSIEVLRIQSITVAFTFLMTQWGFALLALKRTRAILIISALGLSTAIVLAVILGSVAGAKGASVALVGAEAVLAAGYAVGLHRAHANLRIRRATVPRVAVAAAASVGVATITSASSFVATIVGVAVYLIVLTATGGLPPELRELVPRRRASDTR
jgi:O-antigen/teichoic acid export membrane protein